MHVNASVPSQIQKHLDNVSASLPARPSPSGLIVRVHVDTVFSGESQQSTRVFHRSVPAHFNKVGVVVRTTTSSSGHAAMRPCYM